MTILIVSFVCNTIVWYIAYNTGRREGRKEITEQSLTTPK